MHLGCTGDEIRQILQGVTEWVASMVDDSADPFGDLASTEKSGELSSITAHVADAIFQMAGTLDGLGAEKDMNIEIIYELDLGVRATPPSLVCQQIVCRCIKHLSCLKSIAASVLRLR